MSGVTARSRMRGVERAPWTGQCQDTSGLSGAVSVGRVCVCAQMCLGSRKDITVDWEINGNWGRGFSRSLFKKQGGTSLVVCVANAGGPSSTPGQGTRSHMP